MLKLTLILIVGLLLCLLLRSLRKPKSYTVKGKPRNQAARFPRDDIEDVDFVECRAKEDEEKQRGQTG